MTPNAEQLLAALEATWPAARVIPNGPWLLREGKGGGQRVSSATAVDAVSEADVDSGIAGMLDLGQTPLFMVRAQDAALDLSLEKRGFQIKDPVTAYIARVSDLMGKLASVAVTPAWPPLSIQREIWAAAGIGPARVAVMDRVKLPKTTHLGRSGDVPAGTAFIAIRDKVAMMHALEVLCDHKRQGVGRKIMTGAANWAAAHGAQWLSVLVVTSNQEANAFYQSLGMIDSGIGYHYRRTPEGST